MLEYQMSIALTASPIATKQCVKAFSETDFRDDLANISVPTLIVHGDADKIVPEDISANVACTLIANCQFILYPGAPHGLFLTHKERLNNDLLLFFRDSL
ncbi:alpha/beta hydrolase [Olivibacter sp. 47]|nr:alpha/beta hydrolase [Olivibacter sp. 47]MDM8173944.1 alpha/beta hydrolase [Olivibacter sp. 47]